MDDDEDRDAPPAVVASIAAGTAPLPFLAVYAALFIVHGSVHPVNPPDVTTTKAGELVAGIIALLVFIVLTITLLWFLGGRRRWAFVVGQVGVLGAAIDFLVDPTKGGPVISLLIAVTSVIAIVLALAPQSWEYVGRRAPTRLITAFRLGRGTPKESAGPTSVDISLDGATEAATAPTAS
jgi:hypothetical protein